MTRTNLFVKSVLTSLYKTNVKQHVKAVHNQIRYQYASYSHKATKKGSLKKHRPAIQTKLKIICDICGKNIKENTELNKHGRLIHIKIRPDQICSKCQHTRRRNKTIKARKKKPWRKQIKSYVSPAQTRRKSQY